MTRIQEITFTNPAASDLDTLIAPLRPEVAPGAMVLTSRRLRADRHTPI
jgi:hypothetical protein